VQVLAGFRIAARLFGGGENAEFLLTLGKVVAVVSFGIGSAVVNIAGDVLLIPHYGAMGAVAATGAANLLVTIGTYVKVRQIRAPDFRCRPSSGCSQAVVLRRIWSSRHTQAWPISRLLLTSHCISSCWRLCSLL